MFAPAAFRAGRESRPSPRLLIRQLQLAFEPLMAGGQIEALLIPQDRLLGPAFGHPEIPETGVDFGILRRLLEGPPEGLRGEPVLPVVDKQSARAQVRPGVGQRRDAFAINAGGLLKL